MTDRRVNNLPEPPADDPTLALAVGPLAADLCECEALCTCDEKTNWSERCAYCKGYPDQERCTCDRIPWLRETDGGFRIEDRL